MSIRIFVAGDDFILPSTFKDAVRREVDEDIEFSEYRSPWPGEPFRDIGEVTEASGSEADVIAGLDGARVMVGHHAPVTRRVLESASDLEFVAISRGGPTNANIEAATELGIPVSNAPGRNATATAEHAIGLMLSVLRQIPETHAELRGGTWRGDYYEYDKGGLELEDTVVGLIGYGAIGSRVARILSGFGSPVLVHDPYVDEGELEQDAEKVSLDDLLDRARVITLHARVTDETQGMIGQAEIERLRKGSVIINCARGALLDYDAVCDALESGHLWGAGFDVYPAEPIPEDSRLLTAPNLVITPHIAGASKQTAEKAARIAAEEVGRFLRGEELQNCMNPDVQRTAE